MAVAGVQWFLDAGPLTPLASVMRDDWHWPGGTLHICGEVAAEARRSLHPGGVPTPRQNLLDRATEGITWVEVHRTALGSRVHLYYQQRLKHLLRKKFHAGEAESIAWCVAGDLDAVFVTQDITAMCVALSELGPGRVALPFDLWRWLLDERLIDHTAFEALCQSTWKNMRECVPGIPARLMTGL